MVLWMDKAAGYSVLDLLKLPVNHVFMADLDPTNEMHRCVLAEMLEIFAPIVCKGKLLYYSQPYINLTLLHQILCLPK